MRRTLAVAAAAAVATGAAAAGCAPEQAPPAVVVNTPPSDGGLAVLLAVALAFSLVALLAAGVLAWLWAQERQERRAAQLAQREAEDALLALTGRTAGQIHVTYVPTTLTSEVVPRGADR